MTTAVATVPPPPHTVRTLLMDKQQEILAALPRHITPAYFMRVVLTAVQRNPKLAQCTSLSFLGAVLQCAQLGLVPDGFLGQAYLIPYENRKRNPAALEVQFQAGYRGLITLARRSGEISNVGAEAVYEKDKFHHTRGMNPTVDHVPFEGDEDPGPLTHVYAWYRLKDGGFDLNVMNRRQVHKIRSRSQAYNQGVKTGRNDSPWFTDEAWMWKKTVIKQLLKLAPLSVEIQRATGLDDAHEAGLPQDLALLADPNAEPTPALDAGSVDEETGEDLTVEMPQRASEQQLDARAHPGDGAGALREAAPAAKSAQPAVAETGRIDGARPTSQPMIDRLVDVGQVGTGWAAKTEGGLMLWTRDASLGAQLVAAKGSLRQITADPADAQGRRKLTSITA